MATYRINGFSFNRASVAGIDGPIKNALIARMAVREREICTVETHTVLCADGPFEGQTIELSEGSKTATLSIKGWTGHYDGAKWIGTKGQPVNVIPDQTNLSSKQTDFKAGKGFTAFTDLLGELAEDFSGRVIETVEASSTRAKQCAMDDFGFTPSTLNEFAGTYALTERSVPLPLSLRAKGGKFAKKYGSVLSLDTGCGLAGNAYFMDDFGDLHAFKNTREVFDAPYSHIRRRLKYSIGRTSYTIAATAEAVASLRQKVIKAKRCFADKFVSPVPTWAKRENQPRMEVTDAELQYFEARTASPSTVDASDAAIDAHMAALAAQDVAQVVAMAQAGAAIEQAQSSEAPAAEVQELATVCEGESGQPQAIIGSTSGVNVPAAPVAKQVGATRAVIVSRDDGLGNTSVHVQADYGKGLQRAFSGIASAKDARQIIESQGVNPESIEIRNEVFDSKLKRFITAKPAQTPAIEPPAPAEYQQALQPAAQPNQAQRLETSGVLTMTINTSTPGANNAPAPIFYHKGDQARYTGKTQTIHGATFHEFEFLEGANTGKTGVTQRAPDGSNPGQAQPEKLSGIVTPQVPTAPAPAPRQNAAGKSGAWTAQLYKTAGAFSLDFMPSNSQAATSHHATGRDRMAMLQALAREADKPAPTPDPAPTAPAAPALEETQASTTPATEPAQPASAQPAPADHSASPATTEQPAGVGVEGVAGSNSISAPAFQRTRPFNLDPRALLADGVQAAQLIGLGVNYTGNMASPDGEGAITDIEDTRGEQWGALRITCTLEDGRTVNAEPHHFTERLLLLQFNGKHHGAPYLAQLAGAAAMHQARTTSAADLAKQAKEKALQDLPTEYSYLQQHTQGGKLWGVTLAAANIRIMLKRSFPGVKFSVKTSKFSMGDSLTVSWTDGPTDKAVNEIVDMFSGGSFDGMTDSYEQSTRPFTTLFGDAKYTHTRREESDALVQAAIDQHYEGLSEKPTVADYRNCTGMLSWNHDSDLRRFNDTLSNITR